MSSKAYRLPLLPLGGSSSSSSSSSRVDARLGSKRIPSPCQRQSQEWRGDSFPLFELPTDLLARVLVFLPSSQVAQLRTLCKVLGQTGKIAMMTKLAEAGVEGEDFETLTTNARNFVDQNQRIWGILADQLCLAWHRYHKNTNNYYNFNHNFYLPSHRVRKCVEVPFYPLNLETGGSNNNSNPTARKILTFLDCPDLANRFALRRRTVDGQLIVIGVKLSHVPLRARVPVKKHLEELECQRNSFTTSRNANLFAEESHHALLDFLQKKIEEMRLMERRGIPSAFVSYIPKVLQRSRLNTTTTTYDRFVAETRDPLCNHTLIAKGVGQGDDCVVGINLEGLQLAFQVPKEKIDVMYDRGVQNVIQKTTNNWRRLGRL